jgi:general secretion pathway protein C
MKISPRHLVWVNLALLAMVAYWGASTVSTAIAAKLTPPPVVAVKPPPPPIARDPKRPASYYAAIQTRDVFNSTKPEPEKPPEPPKPTECKLKLLGVAVHSHPGSSYCVIEDATSHKTPDVYKVGEQTPGCGSVKRIEWDRVILDRAGQEEILELAAPGSPTGGPGGLGGMATASLQPRSIGGVQPGTNPHIQQVGENQYYVDRSEVDSAVDNMNQLFTQIRAVPHFEGGKSIGFRLFAIRQNSIFDQIGLKNGDIIQSINGSDINDPARALQLFQEMRNERELSVEVMRNKQPVTLKLSIR